MENPIIVPFDLNTARKIKSGEIEGSVLIDNIETEFVYESKDCAGPYNLLFVRKDGLGCQTYCISDSPSNRYCLIGPIECNEKLIEVFKKGITVKLKYVEKRVLDTFTNNGIDLSNYTHCIIVKRNFYLAW
mgnify:CR=1 FL=1